MAVAAVVARAEATKEEENKVVVAAVAAVVARVVALMGVGWSKSNGCEPRSHRLP